MRVGYSDQIVPGLTLQIGAGVSKVTSAGSGGDYVGYDTSASLKKLVKANTFSLSYNQDSGQASGVAPFPMSGGWH